MYMNYLLFLIGAIFGSFFCVVSIRLPKNEKIIFSRSKCDSCNATLRWYSLIPIISYIIQLGKCLYCKKRIPILYPIIEIICGTALIFLYKKYGISYEFFCSAIIFALLIIIFITDFKFLIILDSPLIVAGILVIILKLYYFGYIATIKAFFSGLILFFIMLLIGIFGKKAFHREALGGGDIKLTGIIGLILGVRLGLCALALSAFLALPISLASIMTTKNNEIPFGPFLIGSLFVIFLFMTKFTNLINLIFTLL